MARSHPSGNRMGSLMSTRREWRRAAPIATGSWGRPPAPQAEDPGPDAEFDLDLLETLPPAPAPQADDPGPDTEFHSTSLKPCRRRRRPTIRGLTPSSTSTSSRPCRRRRRWTAAQMPRPSPTLPLARLAPPAPAAEERLRQLRVPGRRSTGPSRKRSRRSATVWAELAVAVVVVVAVAIATSGQLNPDRVTPGLGAAARFVVAERRPVRHRSGRRPGRHRTGHQQRHQRRSGHPGSGRHTPGTGSRARRASSLPLPCRQQRPYGPGSWRNSLLPNGPSPPRPAHSVRRRWRWPTSSLRSPAMPLSNSASS